MRTAVPADHFPAPYPNENAARAANNGLSAGSVPDIQGTSQWCRLLYSLLTSYEEAPADLTVPEGMYYNAAYSGHLIAMPQPLYGDDVTYADGADSSVVCDFPGFGKLPGLDRRASDGNPQAHRGCGADIPGIA